ncbi:MAG: carotenoid 1,2-hydratase [Betaproteobacteria bacterium]|nr:carotenoid 1,2-hydratase [Betaproteobacteria bacterium]
MRREFLLRSAYTTAMALGLFPAQGKSQGQATGYPAVLPRPLVFPRDYGAHPAFRTEWWYLTAWLDRGPRLGPMGFQYTFFRSRTAHSEANPSRFAPRQLLFAHLALALPENGRLLHYDRVARVGPGGVRFSTENTALQLEDWQFSRDPQHRYQAQAQTSDFSLRFTAQAQALPVLRGRNGVSAKGPSASLASYYYSAVRLPIRLACTAAAGAKMASFEAQGLAWLDHEWSSSLLAPGAVGWDWIGIHLLDGGSLMAFRIRRADGTPVWQVWDWREASGQPRPVARDAQGSAEVQWQPEDYWQSHRSGARYPVAFLLRAPRREWRIRPMMPDQEVDARASTGGFYWEGAVVLESEGRAIGRGYLELTGYAQPLTL